ncbi:MAG: amidohydrolase [Isosphaeraceae bacterium]|jgi:predicted amidohydrolase|nr:MAG: amidohydrolase [Isosphaeraceae bacterium]
MATQPSDRVRIAVVQNEPRLGAVEANRRQLLQDLESAADAGADLVVLPECSLSGYMIESREQALGWSEPADGPTIRAVEGVCGRRGVGAIFGFLLAEGSRLFNACAVVAPGGLKALYRKTHLPAMGVDRFVDAGDRLAEVVELVGVRVGVLICYDGAFPEPARVLTLAGAELLVLPTNWPAGAEPLADHMMACRAMENVVYTVAASRVGSEAGTRYIGGSAVYDPYGRTLTRGDDSTPMRLQATIEPALARTKRIVRTSGTIDRIADRRPELYGPLVEPVSHASRR